MSSALSLTEGHSYLAPSAKSAERACLDFLMRTVTRPRAALKVDPHAIPGHGIPTEPHLSANRVCPASPAFCLQAFLSPKASRERKVQEVTGQVPGNRVEPLLGAESALSPLVTVLQHPCALTVSRHLCGLLAHSVRKGKDQHAAPACTVFGSAGGMDLPGCWV